ncbi:hypothetical protein QTP70_000802 [Hemibagrus guttatus]|uniref:Craniofacial development protein 2-like n=1 Tax=Hemibagrus guttatus TaxID=175788 RepID=A0AAE0QRS5_9TELE|nr:hypothetical protein QTP70_000802 [Hemibagrus guttatus]KAK3560451.1 hypothetical protein QTP86_009669 [Hemibagrus guttatus]
MLEICNRQYLFDAKTVLTHHNMVLITRPLKVCCGIWHQYVSSKSCCELEEKERFWSELDEVMESIPTGERVVIGADFNGHVKERNLEGQMVVDFAKRMDMAVD